jgi:predicted nucleic acid-binding protein
MKVLLDTNVVQDAIENRKPFSMDAQRLFLHLAEQNIQGFVTSHAVSDIYYVCRKRMGNEAARSALRNLFQLFTVLDTLGHDSVAGLDLNIKDYEDAVMLVCAERSGMDCLITRDKDLLKAETNLLIVNPAEFLKRKSE